jgi:hypothetical protein
VRSNPERNLRLSLQAVADLPMAKRKRVVGGLDPWKLLSPPWQGLLLVAIQETPLPDEGDGHSIRTGQSVMMKRKIGRRGGKASIGNPLSHRLDDAGALVEPSSGTPAYRLASLLVHKTLKSESWDNGMDSLIDELRSVCMQGVHPVWGEMAEKTPILAQFAAFPVVEVEERAGEVDTEWVTHAHIDPTDLVALGELLSVPFPGLLEVKCEVEIRRLATSLARRSHTSEWLTANLDSSLLEMSGQARILSSILMVASGDERAGESLTLSAVEIPASADLVADILLLMEIRNNGEVDWKTAIAHSSDDGLGQAIKREIWSRLPLEVGRTLSLAALQEGMQLLTEAGIDDSEVRWSLVASHFADGDVEKAREILSELKIKRSEHFEIVDEVTDGDSMGNAMKTEQIDGFSISQLVSVVEDESSDDLLRINAAEKLQLKSPTAWIDALEVIVPLLVGNAKVETLASTLRAANDSTLIYPWEVILVHHLHLATADEETAEWLKSQYSLAVVIYEDTEPPSTLSELAVALLRLLEGSNVELNVIAESLSREGFLAFKTCRYSLTDPEMLIRESELEKMVEGVAAAELGGMEGKLFTSVVENVTLNRAAFDMQRGEDEGDVDRIEQLIVGCDIRHQLLLAIKEMVLEHHISVPSLIPWFQNNEPTSVHHLLVRAAVCARNGERLEAARIYSQAGNTRDELHFDDCISMLRTSLIHFAHAENWVEAYRVLQQTLELSPSLTPLFKLYLKVQYFASQNRQDEATKILLEAAMEDVERKVFNDADELEYRTFNEPTVEKLDRLMRYPISRKLPEEPFQGRIRAAMRSCERRGRRQSKVSEIERAYNESIRSEDLNSLYILATEQSDIDPLRGLALLDRAIHSGQILEHKARKLKDSMISLYQRYSDDLAVSDRRLLRNLSLQNLVVVDTNILIDALQRRIAQSLDMSSDIRLDLVGHRHFHHMLLYFAKQNRLVLHVTATAEAELRSFAEKEGRLQSLFDEMFINPQSWAKETSDEKIEALISGILKDFNTWRVPRSAPAHKIVQLAELEEFLLGHREIYEQLTDFKLHRSHGNRSVIGEHEEAIFPEAGDIEIMLTCANLAGKSLPKIGSIIVASQDSDFTHVTRAFEDEFGFTVAKNTKQLRQLLIT